MYKSRTLKSEKCDCSFEASPLKNIKKKFGIRKQQTIKEKDVFQNGCNKKLFTCDYEPKIKKKMNKKINIYY